MYSNTPSLRLDTSALQGDAGFLNVEKEKSPRGSVRSRALSVSNIPGFRASSSPNSEKPPTSPLLTKPFDFPTGNKGKTELVKVLIFQLDQISQRPKAPSSLEAPSTVDTQTLGTKVVAQAIEKSISLVNQDGDEDEASLGFSSDQAANLTQQLRDVLLVSLDRGLNLFDEDSSVDVFAQASKIKSSASPFRKRRRSQSITRSRSPSPARKDSGSSDSSALLMRCLRLLQSLITEDCRFPVARPRPGFPPNALQAFCLDIAQILISLHSRAPAIVSQIAFAILPAFSTFSSRMLPRLLQFFEESLLRDMLSKSVAFQSSLGSRDTVLDDLDPPAVAIQVEEPDDAGGANEATWRRWLPRSEQDQRSPSSNSPGHAAELYQLASVVAPLLSAALERFNPANTSLDTRHRFVRLFEMIIHLKPDSYLDVLQVVAYHVPASRRRGLSLLASYWPRSLGHFTVSNPLSILEDNSRARGQTHIHSHQFVPWRFGSRPRPVIFDGSSSNDCRMCLRGISEFGLFCPFCMCAVHYDCYDYPEGNLAVPYVVENDPSTQKLAVYRFCHTVPQRYSSHTTLQHSGHTFRKVNLLSTTLCFVCRTPLWGCWEQAIKCDLCSVFAHAGCVQSAQTHVEYCGSLALHSGLITIPWDTLRSTFCSFYADCLSSDFASGARYEELAILSDQFFVQRQLLVNGLDLGSLVVQGYKTLPAFELDDLVNALHDALSARQVFLSPTLEEFLQENQLLYTQHSMLYDWPTLLFVASTIRTPTDEAMPTSDSSTSFLAAQPLVTGLGDSGSNPSEVLTLAHLRDALGVDFHVVSEPAARVLLSHLHHVGFYDRLDFGHISNETFARPEKIVCVFPLPLGLDVSVDVEILVTSVEASLSDIDLSVNEAGFLLLIRRFWPNQMMTTYALQRLARAIISWVINEDAQIAVILREFVSAGKSLPGVRGPNEKQPWPHGENSREIHATSANNGGDYVAHRRSLLQRYASVWLLALHDQDISFYASAVYETISDLTEEASLSEQVKADELAVYLADTSLRSIMRLSQASVVFTVFDDLLLRWLESTSSIWDVRKPVATLTRLLARDVAANNRSSSARYTNTQSMTDSSIPNATDPWTIIMRAALSGKDAFQQALQWLAMMSSSGVDIPVVVFQQFATLSARFELGVVHSLPLVSAAFCSVWLRSLGRQDLHTVIGVLHLRLSDDVVHGLNGNPNTWPDFVTFIRLSLATCLLVAGCEREKLISNGFVHDHEVRDLPSRRSLNARNAGLLSDPINLSTRLIAALGDYVKAGVEQVAILVARFFHLFMRDSQYLEAHEVDNFVLRNAGVLGASAWAFYELKIPELYSLRPNLLLHVLSVEPQPFDALFAAETSMTLPWEQRLKALKRVFRIIMDVTSPEFNVDGRQWRSSVVFIFMQYFKTIWLDPQEEVRTSILVWSKTLLAAHFEQIALCWNEASTKMPIADRTKLIAFLMQLHVHFPNWQMLSWGAICETLMEEDYLQQEDASDPAAAHLAMYGVDSESQEPITNDTTIDSEALSLYVSTVLLSLKLISAGLSIDTNSYMTVKFHLLRVLGFKNVATVPSSSGQAFYISFTRLSAVAEYAWPCADELLTLFDAAVYLPVSPAMTSASQEEEQRPMLAGTIFVDVLLALVNDLPDLTRPPYLSAKALLEALLVVIYKHDFDGKALAYLFNQLRIAARRALAVALSEAPYDLRQLGVSVAHAFIKIRHRDAGGFVPDALDICAHVMSKLGFNKEDVLMQQALNFMEFTLSAYGEQAILLALFKKKQDAAVHEALKQATMGVSVTTAAGESVALRDLLLGDTLTRINTPDSDAETLHTVLVNLETFLSHTHAQPLPVALLKTMGAVFNGIIRRAAEWSAETFDPSVLLSISTTAIQYNKANSRDLLLATETLLRAALARFHVSTPSLARLLEVTLDSGRRQRQGGAGVDRAMNPVSHAFLDIYTEALRGGTHMLSSTLKSMTEAVLEKFIEGDAKTGGDAVMWANRLPPDALKYLLAQGASQGQSESDFDASLRVAQMVFDGVEHSPDFFHQGITAHLAGKSTKQLRLRTWNVLILAAISREQDKSAQALLRYFVTFAAAFHETLLHPATLGPTDRASDINHAYISIKLWLLLGRKLAGAGEEHASNVLAFRFWNELWPPFLQVFTMLMTGAQSAPSSATASVASTSIADLLLFLRDFHSVVFLEIVPQVASLRKLQAASRSDIAHTKLDRTLREINNPVALVPWQTLLDQARVDVISAEKLEQLEAHTQAAVPRTREAGRAHAQAVSENRSSRIVT